jgi:formylglycine-generating enzyme required for sulfatase activity
MSDELIGTHLGQYQIAELIRQGGMSIVYKAYQPALDRFVAIKVLQHTTEPQFALRFKREARAIAQLQHQNILPVYDSGEQDGLLYLVLQYIEGGVTLGDKLGTPVPPANALQLMIRLLTALEYAHTRGIVHRDVKPSNVLLPAADWPMLADFGIARLMSASHQRLTLANQIVGTAAYMAPEQAAGRPVDARTDLYATGVVLYEMLTGRVPFDADTPLSMLTKHVHEPPPPPRDLNPNLLLALESPLLRALAKDPDERYQSAAEMAADLEHVAAWLDHGGRRERLTGLYQAGMQAFEEGHWDQAVERLRQVVEQDNTYEDASDLLVAAQAAQERARAEARQQIEQVRLRRQSTVQQPVHRTTTPAAATRDTSRLPSTSAPADILPASAPPQTRSGTGRRPLWTVIAPLSAMLLIALVWFVWPRSSPQPAGSATTGTPVPTSGNVASIPDAMQSTADVTTTATGAPVATAANPTTPAGNGHTMNGSTSGGENTMPETDSLPEPPGQLVYEDDFEGDVSTESAKTGLEDVQGDAEFNPGFHTGVYRMELSKPNVTHAILLPRLAFANFSMRIDLSDDSDTPAGDIAQGVVFRAQDDLHFYAILVDRRLGQYAVRKLSGADNWSDLVTWKPSSIVERKAEVNRLRVDVAGNTFAIYLNGQMLDQVTDTTEPFAFGMLGMIAANVDAVEPILHFDNLKIWRNDPAGPAAEPDSQRAMIRIPAGPSVQGSYLFGDQKPQIVILPNYLIDQTEVTNAAYKQCVDAGICTPQQPNSDTHPNYANDPQYTNYSATHIDWKQARAFCEWSGKRLPTEAEWEKAASWNAASHEKYDWPWGNTFDPGRLNSGEAKRGDTTAAGAFPAEINGTFDMAGNVSEWTSSLFMPYPYDPADGREDLEAAGDRVYRGGSYLQTKGKARGFFRRGAPPTTTNREIGFRCAAD